jgi:hypothetical protein
MRCAAEGRNSSIVEFCARKSTAEDTGDFEKHLADCSECSRQVASQLAVWNALSDWEPAAISDDFDGRVYTRIQLEESPKGFSRWINAWSERWSPQSWYAAIPIAALLTIVFGILLQHHPPQPQTSPEIKVESIDADQVEHALDDLDMLKNLSQSGSAM